MIDLEKFNGKEYSLSEIYQQVGMTFAFVSKESSKYTLAHQWVKCRDFLNDVIRYEITGNRISIYGFSFGKDNPRVSTEKIYIAVSMDNVDKSLFKDYIKSSIKLLRHFEREAGVSLSRSKLATVSGSKKSNVVVICSNKMWLESPVLLSIYTLLIRLGVRKDINTYDKESLLSSLAQVNPNGDNDSKYLSKIHTKLHYIITNAAKLFSSPDRDFYRRKDIDLHSFHNYCGVVSVCDDYSPSKNLNKMVKEGKI